MRNTILPLIVNIWPEIMFLEGRDGNVEGEGVSCSSFTTTEKEVGVIKLSIAVKGHTLRILSRKSNSSAQSGPAIHHTNKFSG
jgi:hypothetical protein